MSRRSTEAPRGARAAVAVVFLVNGAVFANWVPRIPAVKSELGLSMGQLGVAILGMGVGGLGASLLAGTLVERHGSRVVTLLAGLGLCAALVLPALAPSWAALAGALVVLGAADASTDVAMNAHAVTVQHRYGRSILNSFHGFWSLGAVLGSLSGSFAAARNIPVAWHLAAAGGVLALVTLTAAWWLLPAHADRRPDAARGRRARPALPGKAVAMVGLLMLLGAVVEDTPASWSAVYLRADLGAPAGVAGLAFAGFTAAMTIGRLVGDRVVERVGPVRTTRAGATIAAAGLAGALLIGTVPAALAGFALLGLGMAPVFPLAFSAAGHLPEQGSGQAIGAVSLAARFGILLGAPVIGGLADVVGLPAALGVTVAAAAGVASLAGRLAPAGNAHR